MRRTRLIFWTIVSATVLIVAISGLFRLLDRIDGDIVDVDDSRPDVVLQDDQVLVSLASSNTKEHWLDNVIAQFNQQEHQLPSGKTIVATVDHVTSGGSMNAILNGSLQPVAWSPGDSSWVEQLNTTWEQANNRPLAASACPATIYAPLGFAMWRPMAEALGWPDEPIGWDTLVALAADPDGWATVGRPEWGQFTFGHTHPAYANSGLLSLTGFVYGIVGRTSGVTATDVYATEVETAMRQLEENTAKYGRQAPALLELMASQGTSYLHAAAVPEADTVRFNVERSDELELPLAFIFPSGGTIWAEHPYCVLDNADWVTADQVEAALILRDYLLAPEQQEAAIDSYLRPLDSSIALHAPLDLVNGTVASASPATVPALPSPSADLSAAIIDLFQITKRKASIIVVIDISGSMEGDKIKTARTATVEFLRRLDPNDEVGVLVFNDKITPLAQPARAGDIVEGLAARVEGLVADGNTNLYGAVCDAVTQLETERDLKIKMGESRLYGIILLSDGEDTEGALTENQMFTTCLPTSAETDGIKIFPIAFGEGADQSVLARLAAVSAGRMFSADPESIGNVYISISAEQ